ncbi:MAG: hypothetical protein IPL01_13880 [Acidobacteria bacterium]|nr:hypothetical protein [Acidobacteriota bacterium]
MTFKELAKVRRRAAAACDLQGDTRVSGMRSGGGQATIALLPGRWRDEKQMHSQRSTAGRSPDRRYQRLGIARSTGDAGLRISDPGIGIGGNSGHSGSYHSEDAKQFHLPRISGVTYTANDTPLHSKPRAKLSSKINPDYDT